MAEAKEKQEVSLEDVLSPSHRVFLALAQADCRSRLSGFLFLWLYNLAGGRLTVQCPNLSKLSRLFSGNTVTNRTGIYRAMQELREVGLIDFQGRSKDEIRTIHFLIPDGSVTGTQFPLKLLADYAQLLGELDHVASIPLFDHPKKQSKKPKADTPTTIASGENENTVPLEEEPSEPVDKSSQPKSTKRSTLTPEDRTLICSSLDHMSNYLLWGKPGVYEPDKTHEPSNLNWRQFRTGDANDEVNTGVMKWGVNHFMGYYWYAVSSYRHTRGISHTLPAFSRLSGDIKNLLNTTTNWKCYEYLAQLTTHFDLICHMAGKHLQDAMLDERTISQPQLRNAMQAWLGAGTNQRIQWAQDFQAQVEQRELRLYGKNVYYVQS